MANSFKIANLTEQQKEWLQNQSELLGISMAAVVKQLIYAAIKGDKNE